MRSHKDLLVGEPYITCDSLRMMFSRTSTTINLGYGVTPVDPSIARSICLQLKAHKNWADYVVDNSTPLMFAMNAILISAYGLSFLADKSEKLFNLLTAYYLLLAIFLGGLWIVIILWACYIEFRRPCVTNKKSKGFIKRNMESIIVATISGVICTIVGSLITYYLSSAK